MNEDSLSIALRRVSARIDDQGDTDDQAWRFLRCWLAANRFEDRKTPADLDLALADLRRLRSDTPGRAKLAAVIAISLVRSRLMHDLERVRVMEELAAIADADRRPLPDWPPASAIIRARAILRDATLGAEGFRPRAALTELRRIATEVEHDAAATTIVRGTTLTVRYLVALAENDHQTLTEVVSDWAVLRDSLAPGSPERDAIDKIHHLQAMADDLGHGGAVGMAATMARIREDAARLSPDDPRREVFDTVAPTLEPLITVLGAGSFAVDGVLPSGTDHIEALRVLAEQPGLLDAERATRLHGLATVESSSDDPATLADAVLHSLAALRLAGSHDPRLPLYRLGYGTALLRQWEATGERGVLAPAIEAIEAARAAAGTSAHPVWTMGAMPLAAAYRATGRRQLGRETALHGLRGHVWNVLLQSTVRDMHDAALDVAGDALAVARWCFADNAAADAVLALETGRCLIIHSALETRDVDARLRAIGADGLADRWHDAGGPDAAPAELRRLVISALAGVPVDDHGAALTGPGDSTTHLLDPPSVDEIRAALRATDTDALVYLVPGERGAGAAAVVPVADGPCWLNLPELNSEALAGFERALADVARSIDQPAPAAVRDARRRASRAVPDVSTWAWRAAIGPLLTEFLDVPAERPVRLVLVPMGELARVPWHAARREVDGRVEHALERAVFSYTPSARLLCESAWRDDVPLTDTGMVVGDPDTAGIAVGLPAARAEALAIRQDFYPRARYVGRDAAGAVADGGAGTAAELVDWLTDPDGGPMVHLACHGVAVRTDVDAASYLLLAGGERLTADQLVGVLVRSAGRDLGLAVLACCRTAESVRGYDEAFSLATAFLANRTRSVVSALWSVPDTATSVLMYLFHHYLRVAGLRPADALRAAQLAMIEGRSPVPLPPALRHDGTAEPTAWAAFTHYGR